MDLFCICLFLKCIHDEQNWILLFFSTQYILDIHTIYCIEIQVRKQHQHSHGWFVIIICFKMIKKDFPKSHQTKYKRCGFCLYCLQNMLGNLDFSAIQKMHVSDTCAIMQVSDTWCLTSQCHFLINNHGHCQIKFFAVWQKVDSEFRRIHFPGLSSRGRRNPPCGLYSLALNRRVSESRKCVTKWCHVDPCCRFWSVRSLAAGRSTVMRVNENTLLEGQRVVLVPYNEGHVPRYSAEWLNWSVPCSVEHVLEQKQTVGNSRKIKMEYKLARVVFFILFFPRILNT